MNLAVAGLMHDGPTQRLGPLDLVARAGDLTAIVGPNGAGKSTVIRAILGLVPSSGAVRVGDVALQGPPSARAGHLAWVPQRSGAPDGATVGEIVGQGRFRLRDAWGAPSAGDRVAVRAALDAVGLGAHAARRLGALSGGERQRALVARALASEAPVLLCDEPTTSLDLRAASDLLDLLAAVARAGRVVVVVLHDLAQVLRVADHAVVLNRGAFQASGPPGSVLDGPLLARVWGVRQVVGPAFVPVGEAT